MSETPTLPGLEDAVAKMEAAAASETEVDKLPVYTAERVAAYEPKRYELAARLLFAENMPRRTICRWLHMSPNTLSAIEVREMRQHPERIVALQTEARAEIEQLKRMGREALRARFFDKEAMEKTSAKEIASILKLLDDMSECTNAESNRNANESANGNDYIDAIASWSEDGFGREKIPAPQSGNENAAPATCSSRDECQDKCAESAEDNAGASGQ